MQLQSEQHVKHDPETSHVAGNPWLPRHKISQHNMPPNVLYDTHIGLRSYTGPPCTTQVHSFSSNTLYEEP